MAIEFLDSISVAGSISATEIIYGNGGLSITSDGTTLKNLTAVDVKLDNLNVANSQLDVTSNGTIVQDITGADAQFTSVNVDSLIANYGQISSLSASSISANDLTVKTISLDGILLDGVSLGNLTDFQNFLSGANLNLNNFSATHLSAGDLRVANDAFVGGALGVVGGISASHIHTPLVVGDLTISGNLTAAGSITFNNTTVVTTTSSLSVVNIGPGPALYVSQGPGSGDIASFYDNDGIEVLHVGNAKYTNGQYPDGVIGIKTSFPNKTLTVAGEISATGAVTGWEKFVTNRLESLDGTNGSLVVSGQVNLDNQLTVTNGVTASVGTFTQYASAVQFLGDGYNLTGVLNTSYLTQVQDGESAYTTVKALSSNWQTAYGYVTAVNLKKKQVANVGDGVNANFVVSHDIQSTYRIVQVYDASTGHLVYPGIINNTPYQTTVTFSFVPAVNTYKIVIIG